MSSDALSDEFYRRREEELSTRVREKRFEHSKGVAKTAVKLAKAYGVDVEKARLAGILHDWDKAYDDPTILARVDELGIEVDPELREMPRLLHGYTAAAALKRDYPEIPDDVLQAVHRHTIADENMTDLDMVIYIADALEPHRQGKRTDELRASIGEVPLRELFLNTYAHLFTNMLKRRKRLYSRTVNIWNAYMEAEGNYAPGPGADPFPPTA